VLSAKAETGAGAGEARYGGVADTNLSKSEIAASAFGGLAMTNERSTDLCYLYLPALVGTEGTGAVTQVQAIRDLYQFGIGPFLIEPATSG